MGEPRAAERGAIEEGRACDNGGNLRGGNVGLGRPSEEEGVMGTELGEGKTAESGEDGKDNGL